MVQNIEVYLFVYLFIFIDMMRAPLRSPFMETCTDYPLRTPLRPRSPLITCLRSPRSSAARHIVGVFVKVFVDYIRKKVIFILYYILYNI